MNMSNYVDITKYLLTEKAYINNFNMSNYVDITSNRLVAKADLNNANMSNYVNITSNRLVAKADLNNANMSNYVMITSNRLVAKTDLNNANMSNYVNITSNRLVAKADLNNTNMSNYVMITSNLLVAKTDLNNVNMSNYVNITSNLIVRRMTNLTTDMINENRGAAKRFIINNVYDNNLSVYGNLTITSNLIVLGASTMLETEIYTTERLEIMNANTTSRALVIKQNDIINDIIQGSNSSNTVFTITNKGDVRVTGNFISNTGNFISNTGTFISNNRNVLLDMSNYVLETSNVIAKRLDSRVAILNTTIQTNTMNNSNYTLSASNNLAYLINNKETPWAIRPTYAFSLKNISVGTMSNIDTLTVDGAIICSKGITTSFSDNRLKNYTSNIENPIDLINRINGFHFTPNDLATTYGFSKTPDVGLSAQEVQGILPEIVKLAPFDMKRDGYNNIVSKSGDNFLTICYEKMAPLFVECIKALKKEINELREEVAELRGRV